MPEKDDFTPIDDFTQTTGQDDFTPIESGDDFTPIGSSIKPITDVVKLIGKAHEPIVEAAQQASGPVYKALGTNVPIISDISGMIKKKVNYDIDLITDIGTKIGFAPDTSRFVANALMLNQKISADMAPETVFQTLMTVAPMFKVPSMFRAFSLAAREAKVVGMPAARIAGKMEAIMEVLPKGLEVPPAAIGEGVAPSVAGQFAIPKAPNFPIEVSEKILQGQPVGMARPSMPLGRPTPPALSAPMSPPIPMAGPHLRNVPELPQNLYADVVEAASGIIKEQKAIEQTLATGVPPSTVELPKYLGSVNLQRYMSPDEVKVTMKAVHDANKPMMKAARGEVSHAQTVQDALDLGMTVDDAARMVVAPGREAAEMTAIRLVNESSSRDLLAKLQAASRGEIPADDAILAFGRQQNILAHTGGLASEKGRALSALRIKVGTAEETVQAITKALGGKKMTADILKKAGTLDSPAAVNRFIRNIRPATLEDKVFEWWRNAILWTSQSANIASNTAILAIRPLERALASVPDAVISKVYGTTRTRYLAEAGKDYAGMWGALRVGYKNALRAFSDELRMADLNKLDIGKAPQIAIKGTVGRVVRVPQRMLLAADEFNKTLSSTGEAYAQAYRVAKNRGVPADKIGDAMKLWMQNLSPEKQAEFAKEAAYRTLQQPLGPAGRSVLQLRELEVPGIGVHPLRYAIPFVTTPMNVLKYGIERTPFGYLQLFARANREQGVAADIIARATMGTFVASGAAYGASSGRITGSGPKEKGKRDVMMSAGWKPYSIRLGNKYYSYARVEPIATMVGWVADAMELSEIVEWDDAISKIGIAFGRNITSKTFVEGLSNMIDAIEEPDIKGAKFIQRIATGFVPNIISKTAQAARGTISRPRTLGQALKSTVSVTGEGIPVLRDIWGQPVVIQPRWGGAGLPLDVVNMMVNPVYVSNLTKDPSTLELVRLGASVGSPARILGDLKLADSEYEKYVEASGEQAKRQVDHIVSSSEYKRYDDVAKMRVLKATFERARETTARIMFGQKMAVARTKARTGR